MSIAYLLGAGFSRAVSDHMPVMNDLSKQITEHLADRQFGNVPRVEEFSNDFEAWMTYLSSDEPWLTESENLRNRAAFYEVSAAVASVIIGAQNRVFSESIPAWLTTLVHEWKYSSSTVISFNYDEIVEAAVQTALRDADEPRNTNVYPLPLTPPDTRFPQGLSFGSSGDLAFHLLKLHGSVNWHYSGLDAPTSDPIYLFSGNSGWTPRTEYPSHQSARPDLLVDKSPLIVPPTSVKTAFYGNKILRAAWRLAASALESAHELHVIGYSAPESDLLVRALIGTQFSGSKVVCVNRTDSAANKIRDFFPTNREVVVESVHGVPKYVQDFLPDAWINCVNNSSGDHQSETILNLATDSNKTVARGYCTLCRSSSLAPSTQGQLPHHRCPCCSSMWRGTTSFYYVRGYATVALNGNGQSLYRTNQ